jgi:hypothetical protein
LILKAELNRRNTKLLSFNCSLFLSISILILIFSKQNHEPVITSENYDDTSTAVKEDLAQEMQFTVKLDESTPSPSPSVSPVVEHVKFADEDQVDSNVDESDPSAYYQHDRDLYNDSGDATQHHQQYYRSQRSLSPFHFNKRQTGKKNVSSIIVGSDNKIEFDQLDDKGFGVVKINRPIGVPSSRAHDNLNDSDSVNSRDSSIHSHTADGFFDLKFYSHPLW